jgi:uncharacterized protein YacL
LRKSVFVEIVRLLILLGCTAAGYGLALRYDAALYGTILGAAIGYVCGGVLGRFLQRAVVEVEARAAQVTAGEFLTGALGALLLGALGGLVGVTAVGLLPGAWGWLVFGLTVWTGAHAGFRIAWKKSGDMLSLAGLSEGSPPLGPAAESRDAILVDTNVLIDGHRLVRVARTGFLHRNLVVPTFVLDELQALSDSNDPERRTSGRLGLEALEAIRRNPGMHVHVPDDEFPEVETVDAKLVALATRLSVPLLTNDQPLTRVAELRGVRCLSMNRLANSLSPVRRAGEIVQLKITKSGQHEGEGIAYLEDGSMVVIADASHKVGFEADVRITSSVATARGRIFFAALAES